MSMSVSVSVSLLVSLFMCVSASLSASLRTSQCFSVPLLTNPTVSCCSTLDCVQAEFNYTQTFGFDEITLKAGDAHELHGVLTTE